MKSTLGLIALSGLLLCCTVKPEEQKEKVAEAPVAEAPGKAIEYFLPGNNRCVEYVQETSSQRIFKTYELKAASSEVILTDSSFYEGMSANLVRNYFSYTDSEIQLTRYHYNPGMKPLNGEKNVVPASPIIYFKMPKADETLKWSCLEEKQDSLHFTAKWTTIKINNTEQKAIKITERRSYIQGAQLARYFVKGNGMYKEVAEDNQGNEVFPKTIKGYCK